MLHLRDFVGRSTLGALLPASASFAVAGGLIPATSADAAALAQASSIILGQDRLSVAAIVDQFLAD